MVKYRVRGNIMFATELATKKRSSRKVANATGTAKRTNTANLYVEAKNEDVLNSIKKSHETHADMMKRLAR
ncbi:MAG: hypothetical protein KGZ94_02075 [Clostridia bacterium]|nr:hypothetical protein [Clostridia bacterium]